MKFGKWFIGVLGGTLVLAFAVGTALAAKPSGIRVASDGSEYAAGWLCVKLNQSLRDQLSGTALPNAILMRSGVLMRNGVLLEPRLGVPSVDALNVHYGVTGIERLDPNPHPNPAILEYGVDMVFTVHLNPDLDLEQVAKAYKALPEVEDAYLSAVYRTDFTPNDTYLGSQWALSQIKAFKGYDITHGDSTQASVWVVDPDIGLDWHHEDVTNGLWINSAEDINHNGRFDQGPPPNGDEDGIDNDGNGYVDDVIGWDWMQSDNDPSPNDPGDTHGTHTWGCCMAQTNNALGVASPGYRTHGMGTNTGTGNSLYYMWNALTYGTNKGAKVATMSFGSSSNSGQTYINAAHSAGMNLFGAAGNGYGQIVSYPGASTNVIGVMASGQTDYKCDFSNYNGTTKWYDLCAPGINILSTIPGNTYTEYAGTSMATPITAGVVTLMRAYMPSLTNNQIDTILCHTCDSMPDTLYTRHLLGWGRINMARALGSGVRCDLFYVSRRINDSQGNNNGIADAGETVGLIVRLRNDWGWQTATNVQATLTTPDTSVTITKAQASFPNIASPGNAECSADSFAIYVHTTALPHRVTFSLRYSSTPPTLDTLASFILPVVQPRILLVKDDVGSNYDTYYQTPLTTLNALYDTFNVLQQGSPSAGLLAQYPVVFWWTGNDSTTTLVPADTAAIKAFLDGGGKLFLTGQNIGQDIASKYPTFYANYLHASFVQASSGLIFLTGVDGDPIGKRSGDTLAVSGGGGAQNARSNDVISPVGGAQASFMYRGTTNVAGISYSGTYKLAYFGFPAEAIDGSSTRYVQRDEIFRRILDWFGGTLGVEESSQEVFRYQPVASSFALGAFVPNPVSGEGGIDFSLPISTRMNLAVYNVSGQRIRTLVSGDRFAGRYWAHWDGKDNAGKQVASGVYLFRLQAGGFAQMRNVVVLR